jgi:hypothetical protein
LLLALLAYVWISVFTGRSALRVTLVEQGKPRALSLEDTIDIVRGHGFEMRRAVEHVLARPELADEMPVRKPPDISRAKTARDPWLALPKSLRPDMGKLYIDPVAWLDPERSQRDVSAAIMIVPVASAAHQWNHVFQWSYFYDAGARWFLIYPFLRREDLSRAIKTNDIASAFRVFSMSMGAIRTVS